MSTWPLAPSTLRHPPGPQVNPITGTVGAFRRDPLGEIVRMHGQFGHAVRLRFFGPFFGYLFSHPDHYQHILQTNNHNYTKMPAPNFVLLEPLAGRGLLTNDGTSWLSQRRLAQPAFHRRQIAAFAETMTACIEEMLDRWAHRHPGDATLDIEQAMMQLTLQVAGLTLFSIDLTREAQRVAAAFDAINTIIIDLNTKPFSIFTVRSGLFPSTRRYRHHLHILDEVVNGIIAERRAHPGRHHDLLGMFMQARDEETGLGMDDKQLRDEVMTMMLAGHETTSNLLTWVWYVLATHPAVRDRLHAELAEVLGGRTPTMEDIPNLVYTRRVIDETLRLYPPAYVMARWANEADHIGGYDIPGQIPVTLSTFYTQRSPDFWDNPLVFDPDRFTPERSAERPRFAYMPFGGGPRQCIGNQFALTEATLALAMTAQRFCLELVPGYEVVINPLITLRPRNGMPMRLVPR